MASGERRARGHGVRAGGGHGVLAVPARVDRDQAIVAPALVVHGTADRVVPYYANAELLVGRLPHAEHLSLEGAGHLALLERPDEVQKHILDFVAGNGS